jgi:hypothetical protein
MSEEDEPLVQARLKIKQRAITILRCEYRLCKDYRRLTGKTFRLLERKQKRKKHIHDRDPIVPRVCIQTGKRIQRTREGEGLGLGLVLRPVKPNDLKQIGWYKPDGEEGMTVRLPPSWCVDGRNGEERHPMSGGPAE